MLHDFWMLSETCLVHGSQGGTRHSFIQRLDRLLAGDVQQQRQTMKEFIMTVLVTGGAGYIGSHMVLALRERQQPVIVLDNLSTGLREAVPSDVHLEVGSTGDEKLVRRLIREFGIKTIIHFAASTVVPESVANPMSYFENNTCNSHTLINCAVQEGIKNFVFSSTAAVYGTPTSVQVDETNQTLPESPYGHSKLMTEYMLRAASEAHGMKHVILRYFNVCGADPLLRTGQSTPRATHLIKVAVQAALGKVPRIEIFGNDYPTPDGTCVRDFIHVSDLADIHLASLDYLDSGGESTTLNCGYGRGYSVSEVIAMTKKLSGVEFPVVISPRRAGDIIGIIADNAKATSILAWKPRFSDLEAMVGHALAWEEKLGRPMTSISLSRKIASSKVVGRHRAALLRPEHSKAVFQGTAQLLVGPH